MKTIHGKFKMIDYPVGDNIQSNIPIIKKMYDKIKLIMKKEGIFYDTKINLICCGSSGAIIASIIAQLLCKKYIDVKIRHIKKHGENSHGNSYDNSNFIGYNIIVDDFIASGKTMQYIFTRLKKDVIIHLIAVSDFSAGANIIDLFLDRGVQCLLQE
jgi:orotate phosphoribosyltransferase-like protein